MAFESNKEPPKANQLIEKTKDGLLTLKELKRRLKKGFLKKFNPYFAPFNGYFFDFRDHYPFVNYFFRFLRAAVPWIFKVRQFSKFWETFVGLKF